MVDGNAAYCKPAFDPPVILDGILPLIIMRAIGPKSNNLINITDFLARRHTP